MNGFTPGLLDRLLGEHDGNGGHHGLTLEQFKDSVARDLEDLLNTRCALPEAMLSDYPECAASIVNYGLIDFAGMCMNSDTDQQEICKAVQLAIQRHEPRLHKVLVSLRGAKSARGTINRVEFVITAQLKHASMSEAMSFNAVFRPSLQQYSIEGAN